MLGFNGGLMGVRKVPTTASGSGLWFPNEQSVARRANIWPVGPNDDPYWSNVSLLLHMDGSNGSTTFTDVSSNALTVTASGNAQISTTQSKFGGSSVFFDGNGDYLTASTSPGFAFGTGDFTCEAWIYPTAFGSYNTIIATRGSAGTTSGFSLSVANNGTMSVYTDGFAYTGTVVSAVSLNTWTHVALVRLAGTVQVYANGVKNKTDAVSLTNNLTNETLTIGITGAFDPFTGYIDDLRITKGVARYTADFTPPTTAFPDA